MSMLSYTQIADGLTAVADDLQKVTALYPAGKLSMDEPIISDTRASGEVLHQCGTVHCFAGWYGVLHPELWAADASFKEYSVAADAIAQRCGFSDKRAFKAWADSHPKLWGNNEGYWLFSSKDAFNGAADLTGIVHHLYGVVSRLYDAVNRATELC